MYKSQFHYGSIKTYEILGFPRWGTCLNSTMVRLKPIINGTILQYVKSLNSTMVRLKPGMETGGIKLDIESQFHYGSIKTS